MAIESVLRQTFTDLELIVVDDGSTDDSLTMVKSVAKTDDRIRILTNGRNAGFPFSVNKAMKAASGRYLTTLDSDDLFRPERLERMVDALKGRPDHIAYTDVFRIDKDGKVIRGSFLGSKRSPPEGDAYPYFLKEWMWGIGTVMFPASAIEAIGYFDETLNWGGDLDYVLRLTEKYRVVLVPEALYGYREHESSMTSLTSMRTKGLAICSILESNLKRKWNDLDDMTKYRTIRRIQNIAKESKIERKYFAWWVNPTFMRIAAKRLVKNHVRANRAETASGA